MRGLLIAIGLLSLALGLLGVFLPLLPTTPFLLLAAGCFSRASTRLHGWLLRLPLVGKVLDDYERLGGVTWRSRRIALLMVWLGIGASAFALAQSRGLVLLLGAVAVLASGVILRLPSARLELRPAPERLS